MDELEAFKRISSSELQGKINRLDRTMIEINNLKEVGAEMKALSFIMLTETYSSEFSFNALKMLRENVKDIKNGFNPDIIIIKTMKEMIEELECAN